VKRSKNVWKQYLLKLLELCTYGTDPYHRDFKEIFGACSFVKGREKYIWCAEIPSNPLYESCALNKGFDVQSLSEQFYLVTTICSNAMKLLCSYDPSLSYYVRNNFPLWKQNVVGTFDIVHCLTIVGQSKKLSMKLSIPFINSH
jgi:hypothetical protein